MKKFFTALLLLTLGLAPARADTLNVSPAFSLPIVGNGATVTASTPLLNLTQTWNNAGVTFTGLLANFTDTASAAASLLLDLQVGGSSVARISKSGSILAADGTVTLPGFAFMLQPGFGFYRRTTSVLTLANNSSQYFEANAPAQEFKVDGSWAIGWAAAAAGGAADLTLRRDAANTLAQRNGTTAQAFNIYNTYTNASNYERGFVRWNTNLLEIGTESAGTGTSRSLALIASSGQTISLVVGAAVRWSIPASGHLLAGLDNTYDIGASGATRPRNLFVAGNGTFSGGGTVTASAPVLNITQTWNSGAVTFTGLLANFTDTASAAASLLIDLQVGSASKFSVSKAGAIAAVGAIVSDTNVQGKNNVLVGTSLSTIAGVLSEAYGGARVQSDLGYNWSSSATDGLASPDLVLVRDAANTLALRNGTNSQTFNWYDTYTSATDYHRGALKTARATLSGVTGASVTATGVIPDGAVVVGVTTKVTTGLGTGSGTTGYQVGTVADPDRWGNITGTASGTSSDNTNWTSGTIEAFTADSDVVITANGGNFDGTGVIYVSAQYLIGQAD